MPKYLLVANYTPQGVSGLLKEGGSARSDAARKAIQSVGAEMEAFYYAFGSDDVYVIVDAPDHATMAALSLAVSASGAVGSRTVVLVEPSEIDAAANKVASIDYRPPGS